MSSLANQSLLTKILVTLFALLGGASLGIGSGKWLLSRIQSEPSVPVKKTVSWVWEDLGTYQQHCCPFHEQLSGQIQAQYRRRMYLESFPGDVMNGKILETETTIRSLQYLMQQSCQEHPF